MSRSRDSSKLLTVFENKGLLDDEGADSLSTATEMLLSVDALLREEDIVLMGGVCV